MGLNENPKQEVTTTLNQWADGVYFVVIPPHVVGGLGLAVGGYVNMVIQDAHPQAKPQPGPEPLDTLMIRVQTVKGYDSIEASRQAGELANELAKRLGVQVELIFR